MAGGNGPEIRPKTMCSQASYANAKWPASNPGMHGFDECVACLPLGAVQGRAMDGRVLAPALPCSRALAYSSRATPGQDSLNVLFLLPRFFCVLSDTLGGAGAGRKVGVDGGQRPELDAQLRLPRGLEGELQALYLPL